MAEAAETEAAETEADASTAERPATWPESALRRDLVVAEAAVAVAGDS